MCVRVCARVCVRESEGEGERGREGGREWRGWGGRDKREKRKRREEKEGRRRKEGDNTIMLCCMRRTKQVELKIFVFLSVKKSPRLLGACGVRVCLSV